MNESSLYPQRGINDFPTTIAPARRRRTRARVFAVGDSPVEDRLCSLPVLQISTPAFVKIMEHLTTRPPEAAGVLIGPKDHDVVTHFVPDETGDASPASFTLGHVKLNELLGNYLPAELDAKGIVHSHPAGCVRPSLGDLEYVRQCFALADSSTDRFLLPLVVGTRFYAYIVFRDRQHDAEIAQVVLF